MAKQGREVTTKISDVFRTSYGTVDSSTLKSLYLNLSTWVEPLEDVDYGQADEEESTNENNEAIAV